MQIIYSNKNIFLYPKTEHDAVVVTTNGVLKKDGKAVMGAGIAKSARDAFIGIDVKLGQMLRAYGNHTAHLGKYNYNYMGSDIPMHILTMPTKHHWKDNSDINLIKRSAEELMILANIIGLKTIYMPAPGCNNGHLDWETQVKPILEPILDDRFIVVKNMDNTLLYQSMGMTK